MLVEEQIQLCPKCDTLLKTDLGGEILQADISHGGETVDEALRKLEQRIEQATREGYRRLRVIVGSGAIHDAASIRLQQLTRSGRVRTFNHDGLNRGALIVRLA